MTADPLPIIYATGYVTIPALSATISRSVRVTTATSSVFRGAMAARVNIDLKGNGIATDSFDSMDPIYSTDGLYDPREAQSRRRCRLNRGYHQRPERGCPGNALHRPDGGYTMGAQGTVGDLAGPWEDKGLQPGHYKNDFNMDFPDRAAAFRDRHPPGGEDSRGTNYTWVLGNGNYMCLGRR